MEGAHKVMKLYLHSSKGSLFDFYQKLTHFWSAQENRHAEDMGENWSRRPHDLETWLFTDLIGHVYSDGLRKVKEQINFNKEWLPD